MQPGGGSDAPFHGSNCIEQQSKPLIYDRHLADAGRGSNARGSRQSTMSISRGNLYVFSKGQQIVYVTKHIPGRRQCPRWMTPPSRSRLIWQGLPLAARCRQWVEQVEKGAVDGNRPGHWRSKRVGT